MFISRMPLNVGRSQALRLLGSPYRVHAAVEHSFPPDSARRSADGRILWRVDASTKDKDVVWLYVVSPERPDFSHLTSQAGWSTTNAWETKDYSPVISLIREGQIWQFRLKANPARKVACDHGRRLNSKVVGKTMGHVTVEQQIEWLSVRSYRHATRPSPFQRQDLMGCFGLLMQRCSKRPFVRELVGQRGLAAV